MLTCIPRSKQPTTGDSPPITDHHQPPDTFNANGGATVTSSKQSIKSLTSQIKDMALKASGAYRNCAPCVPPPHPVQHRRNVSFGGGSEVEKSRRWSYARTGSVNSSGRKELEARLKGISSGEGTPSASSSGRRVDPVVFVEESEPKEWVAQVEPGVLITFVSLPRGGNDLKRIRFSREKFNKWQAQKWWAENNEKMMELYNVQQLNRQAFPTSTTPTSENSSVSSKMEDNPVTPPLGREPLPHTLYRPTNLTGIGSSTPDSLDHQLDNDSLSGFASTPKVSSISGTKTETSSSMDVDRSEEVSISNDSSDMENEWVEQDEPGVYITIRVLPGGKRQLKRVRFSREKFGEIHAKVWWDENRARIHKQYL